MVGNAAGLVQEKISNPGEPVVIFALEWCEFCWSVRKFCKAVDLGYVTVDLDSVPYQKDSLGKKIREALEESTGIKTIPQIFIGGEFIGGCTEFFDEWKAGSVQELLKNNGVTFNDSVVSDPYQFLPEWLHPR